MNEEIKTAMDEPKGDPVSLPTWQPQKTGPGDTWDDAYEEMRDALLDNHDLLDWEFVEIREESGAFYAYFWIAEPPVE